MSRILNMNTIILIHGSKKYELSICMYRSDLFVISSHSDSKCTSCVTGRV